MVNRLLYFEAALFAIGFFCTIISSIVLLSGKDGRSPANRFLVYFLASMSVVMFMIFMILTGYIIEVPWLYRLPSPLYYFLFPSAYIYVRMVLLDEPYARKSDWLHAIPALVHLAEMLPYYLSPIERKLAHVLEDSTNPLGAVKHSEGWLPGYLHNLIRGCIGVIYAFLMMRLLWASLKARPAGRFTFPAMLKWLWVLSGMLMLFSLSLVLAFTMPGISPANRSAFLYIVMAGTQIVSTLYLMLNPSILFGMPRLEKMVGRLKLVRENLPLDQSANFLPEKEQTAENQSIMPDQQRASIDKLSPPIAKGPVAILPQKTMAVGESFAIIPGQYNDYINLLNRLMEEKKPFLRKRYSINDLSNDVKVPQHHISYLLNNIFQVRFNDYINQFRLKYINERLVKEDLGHLTLEGLALEAGFSSRITFIRVVQKQTGMNPSEYFKLDL